jgi:RNA recognition motif-containing protein
MPSCYYHNLFKQIPSPVLSCKEVVLVYQECFMKILVRNLARSTTEKELRALFIQIGRVQSCDLVLDQATGQSKGFAFVEMPKVGEAKVAIKKFNNFDLAGNKIRVKKAETKEAVNSENKPENMVDATVDDMDDAQVSQVTEPVTESAKEPSKKFSWKEKKIL